MEFNLAFIFLRNGLVTRSWRRFLRGPVPGHSYLFPLPPETCLGEEANDEQKWRGLFSLGTGGARREGGWGCDWRGGRRWVWIKSRMRSFVLERFSRARQSKDAACAAVTTSSSPFGAEAFLWGHGSFPPALPCPARPEGRRRCPSRVWVRGPRLRALSSRPGWTITGAVCLTSQCHLCRAPCLPNKRVCGGWGALKKNPSWMEERMLSPASNCTQEHCSLPKPSASLLLPAAMPAPGSVVFYWGIG